MSERDLALKKVHKAMEENTQQIKDMTLNATMSEVNIKTYQSNLEYQTKLFNDIKYKLELQIKRAIKNAKESHAKLDKLVEEKEALHLELKAASHYGMVLCEFCNRYYTPQGITRHRNSCSAKPASKAVEKHAKEIKEDKKEIEARKTALQKELKDIEQKLKDQK